jgi:hypothetical protein
MQEITFYEQYEWSAARNAMKFWAVVDGEPVICWADEEMLNTFAQGEDEEKNVQAYFMENEEYIHKLARCMIIEKRFDEENSISITADRVSASQP